MQTDEEVATKEDENDTKLPLYHVNKITTLYFYDVYVWEAVF